jgi:anti-anti-sigma factor
VARASCGAVDADNAHLISELVDSLTRNQSQRLVLDLAQVAYLSAAGVEALLRVRDAVTARAGRLILRDPSPIVLTVLAGTRVTRGFHLHATRGRARSTRAAPPAYHP